MEDITAQEMSNMTEALKNPEFRKLLAEYCNEMSDPKNQALYEQELTQYEAERGIALTFITPEPGFVIKTTVDGREKAFINVSRNGKVDRPTSRYASNEDGRRGLHWSIPLTQAPPRRDYDNKKVSCVVYDVVFHPDTLHLASRNREFRQLVISTACDAVESAFRVRLDRTNVKFPKMAFKGTPRPTVIRKKKITNGGDHSNRSDSDSGDSSTAPLADQFYPKVDLDNLNGDRAPTQIRGCEQVAEAYAVPQYKLVHRRGVDLHEMTYERDAKLNTTLPKELVITVELPLLKSSQNVKLDVRERSLALVCDQPAKYKLELTLPHAVQKDNGKAQFDSKTRQLVVTLPVNRRAELKLQDLNRVLIKQTSDSGLDSPSPSSSLHSSHSSDDDNPSTAKEAEDSKGTSFLDANTAYSLPPFTTNVLDNDVVFTLNVKNVDPASVELAEAGQSAGWTHVKFFSIGAGYAPSHFAFYVQWPAGVAIVDQSAEAWDNNVVLQMELKGPAQEFDYGVSGRKRELQKGCLKGSLNALQVDLKTERGDGAKNRGASQQQAFGVKVRENTAKEMTIELSKVEEEAKTFDGHDEEEEGDCDVFHPEESEEHVEAVATQKTCAEEAEKVRRKAKGKKNKKEKLAQQPAAVAAAQPSKKEKNRKGRSLSESHCEDLKQKEVLEETLKQEKLAAKEKAAAAIANGGSLASGRGEQTGAQVPLARKGRSVSESGGDLFDANGNPFFFKGILKRRFLNRSASESCSSMDEHGGAGSCSLSFDLGIGSITDIPEEEDDDDDSDHLIGSAKKSVTFNDVIKKQLFRSDASIVGRKLKNLKKRAKKRAGEIRRVSESETSECEDKAHDDEEEEDGDEDEDDGAEAEEAVVEKAKSEQKRKPKKAKGGKKATNLEFKSEMIFNLEM